MSEIKISFIAEQNGIKRFHARNIPKHCFVILKDIARNANCEIDQTYHWDVVAMIDEGIIECHTNSLPYYMYKPEDKSYYLTEVGYVLSNIHPYWHGLETFTFEVNSAEHSPLLKMDAREREKCGAFDI
jgi:hypothetical protein